MHEEETFKPDYRQRHPGVPVRGLQGGAEAFREKRMPVWKLK